MENYHKNPKNLDIQKIAVIYPKIRAESFYYRWIGSKDVDKKGNSVDPDQTAPLAAVSDFSYRSSLIWAYTVCPDLCLSENLETLWYFFTKARIQKEY